MASSKLIAFCKFCLFPCKVDVKYASTSDGTVVIEYSLIKRFLELLERQFQQERKYEFKHGVKTKNGLKSVQEITIAKIVVQNLSDYCVQRKNSWGF